MKNRLVCALIMVLAGGVASAGLSHHTVTFNLVNTGSGINDARLRMHIDTLAVPDEDYFIDNVSLTCGGPEILVNGDFSAGQTPWKFYTNAPIPKPTLAIMGGEAVISFGSDGSNTQLFQKDLVLPAAGGQCTLEFDACSTGGPGDPGFGHNLSLKLIKNVSPYTNYGLNLNGAPPMPDPGTDLRSCSAGPFCGDGTADLLNDAGQFEECDEGGVDTPTCDSDCTFVECGDGLTNTAANEECDDGGIVDGDGCDANCELEAFCGDGFQDGGEDCDNGGGGFQNQASTESATCDTNCTTAECGDGTLNTTAGEQCDDGNLFNGDGCDALCNPDDGACEVNYGSLVGDDLRLYGRNICIPPTIEIGQGGGIPVNVSTGITLSNLQEVRVDLSSFGLVFPDDTFSKVIVTCPGDVVKEIDVTAGVAGPTGPTGSTGDDGQDGVDGVDGVDGDTGATGPTGADGQDGLDGDTGATGPTGDDGQDGDTGTTGPTGADGDDGATGVGIQGPPGPTGSVDPAVALAVCEVFSQLLPAEPLPDFCPDCADGVQNQDETDVDCGGACGATCALGQTCVAQGDCISDACVGGLCVVPSCSDGQQNQNEGDVDCGGACGATCALGQTCVAQGDCISDACVGGFCVAPSCSDGQLNQDETGVDCGGACGATCALGQTCVAQGDCISDACVGGFCVAPSCSDGQFNQDETGVDCGGATCPACGDGLTCSVAGDCTSGVCTANVCIASACDDGVQNQDETGVDCGGATCPSCPRFADNGDGTVTDTSTGLIWLKDADCLGSANFNGANARAGALGDGTHAACNLTDGSSPGDWHLPTLGCPSAACFIFQATATGEFSTIFAGSSVCNVPPFIPNTAGTGCWSEGDAFSGVQPNAYWSSTTGGSISAWGANLGNGTVVNLQRTNVYRVWPVRVGP